MSTTESTAEATTDRITGNRVAKVTLREAGAEFWRHPSPWMILATLVGAVVGRVLVGDWQLSDLWAPVAFVILREAAGDGGEGIVAELRNHVAKEIGAIAKPRQIMVVPELPKTRSGKIMRRLLRDVAEKREIGDVTTLADSTVMDLISTGLEKGGSEE